MNRYIMKEEHIVGSICENQKNIEKNEIIMVYLSQGKCNNEFIQIISDIKNRNVSYDDMKNELANKYGVFINEQFEMEVMQMCNYGSYVFNEGKLEGILKLIINKMKKKNISAVDAMIEMDIDEKDFNLYLDKIYKILNK